MIDEYEYTGHPDYVHIGTKVAKALQDSTSSSSYNHNNTTIPVETKSTTSISPSVQKPPDSNNNKSLSVVIIGQGNVALDCARILSKGSIGLYDTDIASHALSILPKYGTKNVTILGRRGHVQGAYTIKELRELIHLQQPQQQPPHATPQSSTGTSASTDQDDPVLNAESIQTMTTTTTTTIFVVDPKELQMGLTPASQMELQNSKPKSRIHTLLHDVANTSAATPSPWDQGKTFF